MLPLSALTCGDPSNVLDYSFFSEIWLYLWLSIAWCSCTFAPVGPICGHPFLIIVGKKWPQAVLIIGLSCLGSKNAKEREKHRQRSVNQTNAVMLVSTEFSSLPSATTASAGNCINLASRQLQAYKTLGMTVQ